MSLTLSTPAPIEHGDRFGKLFVLKRCEKGKNRGGYRYRVRCECKRIFFAKGSKLRNGEARECGKCA